MRVEPQLEPVRTVANLTMISNDQISLGVDLNRGASITYLSEKGVSCCYETLWMIMEREGGGGEGALSGTFCDKSRARSD